MKKEKFDQFIMLMQRFCDYKERSSWDVRTKLQKQGVTSDDIQRIIEKLNKESYLDDQRFAVQFAQGKNKYNKWGKRKIFAALINKRIDQQIIQSAIDSIDDKLYRETLQSVYTKKFNSLSKESPFRRKNKTIKYCIDKGYSYDIIFSVAEEFPGD